MSKNVEQKEDTGKTNGSVSVCLTDIVRPGTQAFLTMASVRNDLFDFDEEGELSFPCCACLYKTDSVENCSKCCQYSA